MKPTIMRGWSPFDAPLQNGDLEIVCGDKPTVIGFFIDRVFTYQYREIKPGEVLRVTVEKAKQEGNLS